MWFVFEMVDELLGGDIALVVGIDGLEFELEGGDLLFLGVRIHDIFK